MIFGYIICTIDVGADKYKVYIDKNESGWLYTNFLSEITSIFTSSAGLTIGATDGSPAALYAPKMRVDEIKIFSCVRSESEITTDQFGPII